MADQESPPSPKRLDLRRVTGWAIGALLISLLAWQQVRIARLEGAMALLLTRSHPAPTAQSDRGFQPPLKTAAAEFKATLTDQPMRRDEFGRRQDSRPGLAPAPRTPLPHTATPSTATPSMTATSSTATPSAAPMNDRRDPNNERERKKHGDALEAQLRAALNIDAGVSSNILQLLAQETERRRALQEQFRAGGVADDAHRAALIALRKKTNLQVSRMLDPPQNAIFMQMRGGKVGP